MAGLGATQWIARCAAEIIKDGAPDLTLVYLPHWITITQRLARIGATGRSWWANWTPPVLRS